MGESVESLFRRGLISPKAKTKLEKHKSSRGRSNVDPDASTPTNRAQHIGVKGPPGKSSGPPYGGPNSRKNG